MQIQPRKEKIKLDQLSETINAQYHQSIRFGSDAVNAGRAAVIAAIETGKLLIRAKAIVGHGFWLKWLADECPDISQDTAYRWSKIASNAAILRDMDSLKSLTQAYQIVGILPERSETTRELGTGTVDIGAQFVSGFVKRAGWVQAQCESIDASTLNPERRQELLVAIDGLISARETLDPTVGGEL